MESNFLKDVLKSTLWILAISSIILPAQITQAADNDLQEWINTTTVWSEARKEVCSSLIWER